MPSKDDTIHLAVFFLSQLPLLYTANDMGEGGEYLYMFTKVMPILVLISMRLTDYRQSGRCNAHLAALIFSLAGDVLLAYRSVNTLPFIMGTMCFACAHAIYLYTYTVSIWWTVGLPLLAAESAVGVICLQTGGKTPWFGLTVLLYACLLAFCTWVAVSCYLDRATVASSFRAAGYVLFAFSDFLILLDMTSIVHSNQLCILYTYYQAQLLLYMGVTTQGLKHFDDDA